MALKDDNLLGVMPCHRLYFAKFRQNATKYQITYPTFLQDMPKKDGKGGKGDEMWHRVINCSPYNPQKIH